MSTASPAEPLTTLENANGTTQTKSPSLPHAKLSAIQRFKSLTTSGFSSSDSSPSFPPASWSLSQSADSGSGASNWSDEVEKWRLDLERWKDQMKSGFSGLTTPSPKPTSVNNSVEEAVVATGSKGKGKADAPVSTEDSGDIDAKDAPEPSTLAMKIKSLIDENFSFASISSTSKNSSIGSQSEPATPGPSSCTSPEITGTLTPKPEGSGNTDANRSMLGFAVDSKLAKLLSSETMMNGGIGKGKESVWSILDRMGYRNSSNGKGDGSSNQVEEDGIMFYTPLQPTTELSPEIAESVLEDDDSTSHFSAASPPTLPPDKSSELDNSSHEESAPKLQSKRVFQPSATQLSVQCTWWGYRLFIPPPVMAQLSNAHIAAAKRGALITAALKWLVDKAPMMMIPPQLRPAMLLLKSFSPYLGYIGAFVAWSWGRVESKDTGNGVVLTATWLLPIAILPASWDFDVHGVPVQPTNTTEDVARSEATPITQTGNSISVMSTAGASFTTQPPVEEVQSNSPSQGTISGINLPVKSATTSNNDNKNKLLLGSDSTRPVAVKGADSSTGIKRAVSSTPSVSSEKEIKDEDYKDRGSHPSSFQKAISRRVTPWGVVRSTSSTSTARKSTTEGATPLSSFGRSVLRRAATLNDTKAATSSTSNSVETNTSTSSRSISRRVTSSGDIPSSEARRKGLKKES